MTCIFTLGEAGVHLGKVKGMVCGLAVSWSWWDRFLPGVQLGNEYPRQGAVEKGYCGI